jgi:hypothetical protein|tara:strand:- start:2411 stop:4306 length:1896 start_codon:yes stop_codon:yes gene_type:complete
LELKEKHKINFTNYIYKLEINDTFKRLICDENFINENPEFYLYYPILFSETFNISKQHLSKLSIAGYLYYQSTLFTDSLIDKNDKSKIALISICQEEAIKILSSIFPLGSLFWKFWNQRKEEYFFAVKLEKELSEKENVSFLDYSKLSDFKSSFGKIAIESLFVLDENKNTKTLKCLLDSHKYFSIAYQLNDDVIDIKEDFDINQFNWVVYKYIKETDLKKYSISDLKKLLYINGKIVEVFKKAIIQLDKALACVSEINVSLWKEHLLKMKLKFSNSIIEIENYLKLLKIEVELSNKKIKHNKIKDAISLAIVYIKKKQYKGAWEDYVNQGGISNIWSTAFITSKLSSSKELKNIFKKNIDDALLFLTNNQKKNGLWGYNSTWIEDADTTNFVFISLALNQQLDKKNKLLNDWEKYKTHQNIFTTYNNKEYLLNSLSDSNIKDVKGWTDSHLCVSAVAFYLLTILGIKNKTFKDLKKYFDNIHIDEIKSYWWTNNIYTYYYLALSYNELNEINSLKQIQNKIAQNITEQGYKDKYGINMFYTALALEVLLLKSHNNFTFAINKSIYFILQNQFSDGSWSNSHSLRIPDPSISIETELPVSTHGINVRAKEFNRLFTTTSILKSLQLWNLIN